MNIERDVWYMQAANCRLAIHIGTTAVLFGVGAGGYGARIELFTPLRVFRFRRRIPDKQS
ncbi:hypothetical protein ABIC65_001036 [Sphingomonas trueperi]